MNTTAPASTGIISNPTHDAAADRGCATNKLMTRRSAGGHIRHVTRRSLQSDARRTLCYSSGHRDGPSDEGTVSPDERVRGTTGLACPPPGRFALSRRRKVTAWTRSRDGHSLKVDRLTGDSFVWRATSIVQPAPGRAVTAMAIRSPAFTSRGRSQRSVGGSSAPSERRVPDFRDRRGRRGGRSCTGCLGACHCAVARRGDRA